MKTVPKFECTDQQIKAHAKRAMSLTAPPVEPVNDSIESADERLGQAIKEHRSALVALGEKLGPILVDGAAGPEINAETTPAFGRSLVARSFHAKVDEVVFLTKLVENLGQNLTLR